MGPIVCDSLPTLDSKRPQRVSGATSHESYQSQIDQSVVTKTEKDSGLSQNKKWLPIGLYEACYLIVPALKQQNYQQLKPQSSQDPSIFKRKGKDRKLSYLVTDRQVSGCVLADPTQLPNRVSSKSNS